MKKTLLFAAVFAAITTPAYAEPCHPTYAQYEAISEGMSRAEVQHIVGCGGVEMSSSTMFGHTSVTQQFGADFVHGLIITMFVDDKLISKSEFGTKAE